MIVGLLEIDLALFEAQSLKDKRRVIKSTVTRLRNQFNAAVAEVSELDKAKRCVLGVVTVANDSRFVHSMLDKIVDFIRQRPELTLLDYRREIL